ncbi:hypothetical protein GQ44DRAFT_774068 [Phaeosphaeriaceae sp. PMI808]|nr:hypothetical protein GQ44DRAFT_774068 [Phaeosphaeriaceae sp. PMI808]
MLTLSLLATTLTLAAASPFTPRQIPAVASVDRYSATGCTGTICNIAGSGDLHAGCNPVVDACKKSLKLSYANVGCKVAIWTDNKCKNALHFANVTSYDCYELGPPILGISVTC